MTMKPDPSMNSAPFPLSADALSPLAEQWPYVRFLGLGPWWAWIWLCFLSPELLQAQQAPHLDTLQMAYIFSTLSIAATVAVCAILQKQSSRWLMGRLPLVCAAILATAGTLLLALASMADMPILIVAACMTGMGTGALCLKVGQVYSTVSIGDSLTAGAISLVLSAFLYFVGIGLPALASIAFIATLPVISALLLTMKPHDAFEGADNRLTGLRRASKAVKSLYVRLILASAIVAITAGIGRGVMSRVDNISGFSNTSVITIFFIGVIGVLIVYVVNRWSANRRGVGITYTALMILGIAMMLTTGFGFPIGFLSIGKEALWLVFSCFMAYMAFRFELGDMRAFGFGQAAYFLGSFVGRVIGDVLSPVYSDPMVAMAVGVAMAFCIVIVLAILFPEKDVRGIMEMDVSTDDPSTGAISEDASAGEGAQTGSDDDGERTSPDIIEQAIGAAPAQLSPQSLWCEERGLSSREVQIMLLFAQGRSANWIADYLVISKNTVRSHLRAVYTKLDVHGRQELLDAIDGVRS